MEKLSLASKNIVFYLILALLVFVPLYPKFPLLNVPKTYVAVRLEDLLIALVLFVWAVLNFKLIKPLLKKPITQAIILFWFVGFVSLVSAVFITQTIVWHLGVLHWLRRVEMMGLFFVAMTSISNIKQVKTILVAMLVTTAVIAVYGFGQIWLDFPVVSTTNREFSKGQILRLTPDARVNSTFAGHYDLAIYLSIVIIFMALFFFYYRNFFSKALITLSGAISFLLLGLTAARASFATTLFGLIVAFWLLGKRLLIAGVIVAAMAMIVIIPELRHRIVATFTVNVLEGGGPKYQPPAVTFTPLPSNLKIKNKESTLSALDTPSTKSASVASDIVPGEPINPTELGVYRSFNIRSNVSWPRAIRAFEKNPILGTGYSSLTIATDNDYLRSLGEVGLLGSASLALVFLILFKKYYISSKKAERFQKYFLIATICSALAVLITGLSIDVLEASKIAVIFWIMLGIGWALAEKVEEN